MSVDNDAGYRATAGARTEKMDSLSAIGRVAVGILVVIALATGIYYTMTHPRWQISEGGSNAEVRSSMSQQSFGSAYPPLGVHSDLTEDIAPLSGPSIVVLQPELVTLRKDVEYLKDKIGDLRRDVQRIAFTLSNIQNNQDEGTLDDSFAEDEWHRRKAFETQETEFQREPVDPSWSAATLDEIDSALRRLGVSDQVRVLECRASTCRMEIAGQKAGAKSGWDTSVMLETLPQLIMLLGDALPSMTSFEVDGPDDAPGTVLYFSRDIDTAR